VSSSPTGGIRPTLQPSAAIDLSETAGVDLDIDPNGTVLKIAHVGDCVGMLVRGNDIIWRTEEMWWDVSLLA
jgi:hypothetical protein